MTSDSSLRDSLVEIHTMASNFRMVAFAFLLTVLVSAPCAMPARAQENVAKESDPTGNNFHPGQVWLDDRGKPIESHLGGLLFEEGVYYWYGMNFDGETIRPGTYPKQTFSWMRNEGVTCYSSKDLYHWQYEGVSLAADAKDLKSPLQPLRLPVRPKVIKCDKTGKYVLMAQLVAEDFHAEGNTAVASFNHVVVATADRPTGPFTVHGVIDPPGGAFDLTLYKDDDGAAYLIVARNWVKAHRLSDDFLSIAQTHELKGVGGEAPAIFKHAGTYYCVTSKLTGWAPNANVYATADKLIGPWSPKGEFATGPGKENTFGGQTTFVLPVAGKPDAFIYLADRLNAKDSSLIEDLHRGTHIWLPITIDPGRKTIEVKWRDVWDLSVFSAAKD